MRPRALVVEDDTNTRKALVDILQLEGCTVDVAPDGELAVGMLAQHRYDIVLLDLILPKISGTDVMEHLLCTKPEVLAKTVVVTGLDVAEIRKLFPNVYDALGKPVIPKRLLNTVRNCLRGTLDDHTNGGTGISVA